MLEDVSFSVGAPAVVFQDCGSLSRVFTAHGELLLCIAHWSGWRKVRRRCMVFCRRASPVTSAVTTVSLDRGNKVGSFNQRHSNDLSTYFTLA